MIYNDICIVLETTTPRASRCTLTTCNPTMCCLNNMLNHVNPLVDLMSKVTRDTGRGRVLRIPQLPIPQLVHRMSGTLQYLAGKSAI